MQELWDLIVYNIVGVVLVIARISGIFSFNPIFSRSNVPTLIKAAMTVALSVCMLSSMGGNVGFIPTSIFDLVFVLLREMVIGLFLGFITNLVLTVLIYAGEIMDNQVGLGMAKSMDPTTGVTMPVFANIYYYIFILYFFVTGCHLSYIQLFWQSYEILPIGYNFTVETLNLTYYIVNYLGTVMTLAVKFALPILAVEMITEVCVGVIMKAVPSIQVFVVNIQLKILLGLFAIMVVAGPMSDFIEDLLDILMANLTNALGMIGA